MNSILGTRADIIMDAVVIVSAVLPFLLIWVFKLAKDGKYKEHKFLQIVLFSITTILVVALELDIRFGTLGEKSIISRYYNTIELNIVFIVHLIFSISSFAGWLWLIIKSSTTYPKKFNFEHKKWGIILFIDLCLTAITGIILYIMAFAM